MPLSSEYNLKSPGVKRLMREACELAHPTEEYYAYPLEDNLFEWHFTVRGPNSTEFDGGYYHGRILLPSQYPLHPPNIILLTPNGRFEVNKKICLSISGHHPESWQPSWSIRTTLMALIAFMPTPAAGTVGSLDFTKEERRLLAKKSKNWECKICGKISDKLLTGTSSNITQEECSLIEKIALKVEENSETSEQKESATIDEDECNLTTDLRQRLLSNSSESDGEQAHATFSQSTVKLNQHNKFWSVVSGILLIAIIFLIFRRLFLL